MKHFETFRCLTFRPNSLRYCLTEIKETASTFFALEERFGYFFRQLNVSAHLAFLWKLVSPYVSFLSCTRTLRPLSLLVFQSSSFINASLLFWQRNDDLVWPSIPDRVYNPFELFQLSVPSSFTLIARFSVSSRFPPQMLLTFYPTHIHTHTSARLVSPTLPPSALTYFFLAFFYSRFGQPHSQRILSSLLPPSRLHPDFH